jgi:polyhydroxyalkanoate synthesis regulator phasin
MGPDERLKRYQEAGADLLEVARAKAEELLRDLGAIGESTTQRAGAAVGELRAGGRRGSEQLLELIRKEVASQLSALGLATKADLADLERRIGGGARPPARGAGTARRATAAAPAAETGRGSPASSASAATKRAAAKTAAAANARPAKKVAAAPGPGTRKAAPGKAAPRKAAGTARKALGARKAPGPS